MSTDLRITSSPTPSEDWDDFVRGAPGATYCHLAAWEGVMRGVLGHECSYVTARDPSGKLEGVLPLVTVRSRLFGHHMVSMPFLNYGGALGSPAARGLLADWARRAAESARVGLLELRARGGPPGLSDSLADPGARGLTVTGRKITVVLSLPEDPEELWEKGLRAKVRSQIRRPMKEGFETRFGPDQVDAFYDVFARNMRDLGTPVLPRRLFEELPKAFGDDVAFAAVYAADSPIAAGCGFFFGDEFEITWASSLRELAPAAPNMLLYWRLIENAIRHGAKAFNFGRCTPGGGTHRFKSQWGGVDEPLPWLAWSPDGRVATPNPEQGKYRLATAVWSRLPVGLTRAIGPSLARQIP